MHRNHLWLIIRREYLSRVQRKTFLIMTLLGPLLMAGLIVFAFWLSLEESEHQHVLVVDDNYPFFADLEGSETIQLDVQDISLQKAEALLGVSDYTAILYLPQNILQSKSGQLLFKKQPSFRVQRQMEERLQQYLELSKLKDFDISESDYRRLKAPVTITTFQFKGEGEATEARSQLPAIVGEVFGILIFLFVFIYSVSVMRGVIEEKSNRIIEVMVSTVKPVQMMLGKIIGVGAVGLTQFLAWVVLTFMLVVIGQQVVIGDRYMAGNNTEEVMTENVQQSVLQERQMNLTRISEEDNLFNEIRRINFPLMIGVFLFYFLGGYLLYSAMMAAVGSAVDSDTDTQQFVFPVTLPLFLAYLLSFHVMAQPDSNLSIALSIIPFTSPIAMIIRIAHGVDALWQVYASMAALMATFAFMVWVAARVYRIGILMYGKKVQYREIIRWIRHT